MLKNKKSLVALAIIPAYIIVKVLAKFPQFIEDYYSTGIYPYISKTLRYTLGWLPFSFGDLMYALAILYLIRWLVINRKRIRTDFKNWCIDIFATASIVYIAFHLFWGMNYYRIPLHKSLNIEAEYTTEALIKVTKKLIDKSNALQFKITKNDTLKVELPYSKQDVIDNTIIGYTALQDTFTHLGYTGESIKTSLLSLPLSYMGFSGYLNPLTNEAQVNGMIPIFKLPTTTSHEVAHQLGYAAENEANFIGCLAATSHNDIYFNYSGYTFGLRHCLHEIYRRNPEEYKTLIATINKGVLKNYKEVRAFWDSKQNPLEPIFQATYSGFLKANNQKGGIKSYSYVVALLVNYFDDIAL